MYFSRDTDEKLEKLSTEQGVPFAWVQGRDAHSSIFHFYS